MNIYVGNLPLAATEDELNELFSEYGHVDSVKLILDRESGRSRGFGFIEMSENAARKAIAELNGTDFMGKELAVNEARPKERNRGFDKRKRSW
jgi:RNA recognition motif-containing protein